MVFQIANRPSTITIASNIPIFKTKTHSLQIHKLTIKLQILLLYNKLTILKKKLKIYIYIKITKDMISQYATTIFLQKKRFYSYEFYRLNNIQVLSIFPIKNSSTHPYPSELTNGSYKSAHTHDIIYTAPIWCRQLCTSPIGNFPLRLQVPGRKERAAIFNNGRPWRRLKPKPLDINGVVALISY